MGGAIAALHGGCSHCFILALLWLQGLHLQVGLGGRAEHRGVAPAAVLWQRWAPVLACLGSIFQALERERMETTLAPAILPCPSLHQYATSFQGCTDMWCPYACWCTQPLLTAPVRSGTALMAAPGGT